MLEIKVRTSEHKIESFRLYDKWDLRNLPIPAKVERINPDCEDQNEDLVFFKLFDTDGDLIEKVAIKFCYFYDIDFKSYGSNFEVYFSEYDFFEKSLICCKSLNIVKSDYIGLNKDDAIDCVEEKIVESFGLTDFDHDFIKTFFDDLE